MRQCFDIPLTLIKGVVKYDGNFDFAIDARQRWSQKCSGCDHTFHTSQKWSQIRTLPFWMMSKVRANVQWITSTNTYSKLILRKEINKLSLNTVLKIFIRQYRTRAGNHGNCCFIIIFVNVLEYVLFQSEIFFCLMLSGSFSPWSITIRCNDSDANNDSTIGRWKTEPKQNTLFWREIVAAANSLSARAN